ncbi:glycosyltransferase family 61 protein [Phenylobacterium sp. J426]|uniref:glycosyltransferase family 61 protein n=1 Tax=Phenylobacterium sp. J426 TaxID=2898439 RepID=UPI0021510F84|nr:glycosyltransferase family 61 protein [Phenylobacterium sp. J426]MCR5872849.1 glycosyltransferase family 61 protein [Phenylobacterium sp. J426]
MTDPIPLPLKTVTAYAAEKGLRQQRLFGASRVNSGEAHVVPQEDQAYYSPSRTYDSPAVTLTELRDVLVRARSNLLTMRDAVLTHDLMNLATDEPGEAVHKAGNLGWSTDFKRVGWRPHEPANEHPVGEAAAFTDWTAPNYAHWMTEVLPRIAALTRDPAHARTSLILDLQLHPNIRRSVELIAPDRTVYRLRAGHVARVARLHHVSATGYVPFKLRAGQPLDSLPQSAFNAGALRHAVRQLRKAVDKPTGARPKVFIRRKSASRSLRNEAEVEAALTGEGFVPVEPEQLSLEDQVALFSTARMVVGATGAAMTNLIFCREDCPIVVLMPRFRHTAYWYWRHMAAAAGSGPVVHVSGPQADVHPEPWNPAALHRDFSVDIEHVREGIARAAALTR